MSKLEELKARIAAQAQIKQISPAPQTPKQIPLIPATQTKILPSGTELFDRVSQLQEALLSRHPTMPGLLRDIHTALRAQPENVTLLNEDQISVIVNGLKEQTGVVFAAAAMSTGSKGLKAKIASQGLDAF